MRRNQRRKMCVTVTITPIIIHHRQWHKNRGSEGRRLGLVFLDGTFLSGLKETLKFSSTTLNTYFSWMIEWRRRKEYIERICHVV